MNRRLIGWFVLIALPLLAIGSLIKSQLSKSVASGLRQQTPTTDSPTVIDPRQAWLTGWLSEVKLAKPILTSVGHTWLKIKIEIPMGIPVKVAVFEMRFHPRSAVPAVDSPFKEAKRAALESHRVIEVLFDELNADSKIDIRYYLQLIDGRKTANASEVLITTLLDSEIPCAPTLNITLTDSAGPSRLATDSADPSRVAGVLSWELKAHQQSGYRIEICKMTSSDEEVCTNASAWTVAQVVDNKSTSFHLSRKLMVGDVIGVKARVLAVGPKGASPPSNEVEVRKYAKTTKPHSLALSDDGKKMTLKFTQEGTLVRPGESAPPGSRMIGKFNLVVIDSTNRTVVSQKTIDSNDSSLSLCSFAKLSTSDSHSFKRIKARPCSQCISCLDDFYQVTTTLVSLDEGRAYEVNVRSHSFAGWSEFSESLVIPAEFKTFPTLQKLRQWSDAISFELHSMNETVVIRTYPFGELTPCQSFEKDKVYCSVSGVCSDCNVQIIINLESEGKFRTRTLKLRTLAKGGCTEQRNGLWFVGTPLLKGYDITVLPEKILELSGALQVATTWMWSWVSNVESFEDSLRKWTEAEAIRFGLKTGLTAQCSKCFLEGKDCMTQNCKSDCIGDPRAISCRECHNLYCKPLFKTCTGIGKDDMLPPPPPLTPP